MIEVKEKIKSWLIANLDLNDCPPHVEINPFCTIMETGTNVLVCTDDFEWRSEDFFDDVLRSIQTACESNATKLQCVASKIKELRKSGFVDFN